MRADRSNAAVCRIGRVNEAVIIGDDYRALLRARRRRIRWSEDDRRLYQRHHRRLEGFHGEARTWNGLSRTVRRGLENMKIQACLLAAAARGCPFAVLSGIWIAPVPLRADYRSVTAIPPEMSSQAIASGR